MRVGIIIGRIGGIDGVSLETEKWIEVLRKMGHEIFILSGLFERKIIEKKHQAENRLLSFFSKENKWVQERAFLKPGKTSKKVFDEIKKHCENISQIIIKWIKANNLKVIISENASALPYHLALGVGIRQAIEKTNINVISHDHDFWWERSERYVSPHKEINKLMKKSFPIRNGKNIKHAVINTAAKAKLKKKYNINAVLVPNVMDFDMTFGHKREYSKSLPKDLGLEKDDIPIFQVTRIVERKGIETAIELIKKLNDKRIKLVIAGRARDDIHHEYTNSLKAMAKKMNLNSQIIFAGRKFDHCTSFVGIKNHCEIKADGTKAYALSDAYAYAKACTYFSTYEGFGNAFLEAVLAKKPIFVNNYKPVFWPDIGSKGFKIVILQNNHLTDKAVKEIKEILYNEKLAKKITEHNFKLGKKHFSYDVLKDRLKELLT